jgi:spore germination cell wall hydrolase CwlJ-like protein
MFRQLLLLVILTVCPSLAIAQPVHHIHHRPVHHRTTAPSFKGVKGLVYVSTTRHTSEAAQPPRHVAYVIHRASQPRVLEAQTDESCLAMAIYHEAKSEGSIGEAAAGYVVLHRTTNRHFPKTTCGVVYQKGRDKAGTLQCQFDFACQPPSRINSAQMAEAHRVARGVLDGTISDPVAGALYLNMASLHMRPPRGAPYRKVIGHQAFYSPIAFATEASAAVSR